MLARILAAVSPPTSATARQLEHLLALYIAYRVLRRAVALGPTGLKKATVGIVLAAAKSVPALRRQVQKEQEVRIRV